MKLATLPETTALGLRKRFAAKVQTEGACLRWMGRLDRDGYGDISITHRGRTTKRRVRKRHKWKEHLGV
jgi:Mn-dependent DtxR family transcriptional regulator